MRYALIVFIWLLLVGTVPTLASIILAIAILSLFKDNPLLKLFAFIIGR